jgi:hypothetical protein
MSNTKGKVQKHFKRKGRKKKGEDRERIRNNRNRENRFPKALSNYFM